MQHRAMRRLPLTDLRSAVMAPVISPLPTVVALIGRALSGRASESHVSRALAAHLRERDIAALVPLRHGEGLDGAGGRPNEISTITRGGSIKDALDAVRAVDPDDLSRAVAAAARSRHPVGPWRLVERSPERWIPAYADALRRAWLVLGPIWSRSAALLDREVERVSVAIARGAGAELVTQLFPYSVVDGDDLLLPSHSDEPGRARVGATLLLHPLLAPASSSGWTDDYADVCLAVRYSVPASRRGFAGEQPPPASLRALVGPQRAKILRRLDRPATAGELAELLHGVPSMVSHHLAALERAGLITRTREGRNVRIRRSARGTELVALYERG